MDTKIPDLLVSYSSRQQPYVERFVARLQSQKNAWPYSVAETRAKMNGKILDQNTEICQESNNILALSDHMARHM